MRGNWAKTGLGEIVEVLDRMRRPISSAERAKRLGGVPYYGANGQTGWINESIFNEELVLLGEDAIDFLNPLARKAYLISGPSWVNNHVHVLRPVEGKTRPYFLTELLNMVDYSQFVSFGTRSKLTQGAMMDIAVSLPPLVDQDRIIDILVSVDAYIAALQQQADDARAARNAVLHELLTAGGDNWTETTLGDIAEYVNGFPFKPEDLGEEGTPVIRIKQLLDPTETCDRTLVNVPDRCVLQAGDIVFSWSGTLAVRVWDRSRAYLNQHLFRVVEKDGVMHEWLPLVLDHAIHDLSEKTHGTTMKHVTKQTLLPHRVQLPPLSEQKRIVGIVTAMDDVVSATEKAVNDVHELRSGLLYDLLSGEHEIPETYDRLLGVA